METLTNLSVSKQIACRSHASGPAFVTLWCKSNWEKEHPCRSLQCIRLCSLIRAASVLVAVIDLCMTKWATYFCSTSRCTCVLLVLHQPLISHEGPVAFVGQLDSEQGTQVRHAAPHIKECRNTLTEADILSVDENYFLCFSLFKVL